ncbi:3814_t:CDS:2, partial [Gigaspora margarita]
DIRDPFDKNPMEAFFQEKLLSTRQFAKNKLEGPGPYQQWYENQRPRVNLGIFKEKGIGNTFKSLVSIIY